MTNRIHGEKALEGLVVSLYEDGWRDVKNIASMVNCKPDTVRNILKSRGVVMSN